MDSIRTFFSDKQGKLVLWQRPNAPLIGWVVFLVAAKVVPAGDWRVVTNLLSLTSLLIWALFEIILGASYFRRALGLVVFIFSIISRLH